MEEVGPCIEPSPLLKGQNTEVFRFIFSLFDNVTFFWKIA